MLHLELVAQDLRVAALGTRRHGLTDEGEGLMAIEAAQLDDFSIELESVIGELCLAKAKAARVFVDDLASAAADGRERNTDCDSRDPRV